MIQEKPKTIKDAVILALSKEWPLTARKLYNVVRKNYGFAVTYQAVHKVLKQMVEEGIIVKDDKDYSISPMWIKKKKEFYKKLEAKRESLKDRPLETFILGALAEVDAFLIDLGSKIVPKDRKSTICLEWDHFWIPLFLDKEVYRKMKTLITNTVFYTITPAKTAIDKWCYEFWKKQNVKAKIGVGNRDSCVVVEDYVIRIFYPRDILKELDKIFSSAKNINDINTNELFHRLFEKKTKIPVVVERNPELAKQIRERIMSYFKSKE
ncbi:MAG: hypothetical protein ACE5GI_07635 [Candidatus Aminicenantales bacterium]